MKSSKNPKSRREMNLPDKMGVYIKARRKALGITQEQLAYRAKIAYKQVQTLESLKTERDPRLSTLNKLARGLEVKVWDMLKGMFG